MGNKDEKVIEEKLENIQSICNNYHKNKSFNIQLITTIICVIFFLLEYRVLMKPIDIGLSTSLIKYIIAMTIVSPILGWLGYFVEFKIDNFTIFKIVKLMIWTIGLIMTIIFLSMVIIKI